MRLLWLTDLHLDFCDRLTRGQLIRDVCLAHPDMVVIGGDTHTAPAVHRTLTELHDAFGVPTYHVFGNHDYYRGSITNVRQLASRMYLGRGLIVRVGHDTSMVGVDGWADCRYGTGDQSSVRLQDSDAIVDFRLFDPEPQVRRAWADLDAQMLRQTLGQVDTPNVVVVTHVPPWPEACYYQGVQSEPDFLPYFACKATGDVLLEYAQTNSVRNITVLCGHTHDAAMYNPLPNLHVHTGRAEYYLPAIQQILTFD